MAHHRRGLHNNNKYHTVLYIIVLQLLYLNIQPTTDITRLTTSIYYSYIAIANDIHWSTYELTADAPCPALTDVPWDVYFELHA